MLRNRTATRDHWLFCLSWMKEIKLWFHLNLKEVHLSVREAMIAASPLTSLLPFPPPPHLQVHPGDVSQSHGGEEEGGGEDGAAHPTPPSRPLTQSSEVETRGAGGRGGPPLPMLWSIRGRPDPDNFSLLSLTIWPPVLSSPSPSPISLLTIPSSFISWCNTCSTSPWSAPRTEE